MKLKSDIEKLRNDLTKNDIYSLKKSLRDLGSIQDAIVKEALKYRTDKNILFKDIPKGKVKQYLERMIDDNPYELFSDDNSTTDFFKIIDSIINQPYYNILGRAIVLIEHKMREINRVLKTLEQNGFDGKKNEPARIGGTYWTEEQLSELKHSVEKISQAHEKAKSLDFVILSKFPEISSHDRVLIICKILGKKETAVYNLLSYEPSTAIK